MSKNINNQFHKNGKKFFIEYLEVIGLWDYRNFYLNFNKDMNILIGPNASGKTTILNLLYYVLNANIFKLSEIPFNKINVGLREFDGEAIRTIKVSHSANIYSFYISRHKYEFNIENFRGGYDRIKYTRSDLIEEYRKLVESLQKLSPVIWLPVSRRLPIPEEEEENFGPSHRRRPSMLESVDECLRQTIEQLSLYRLGLETQLSERYKEFQKRVLRTILFSKEHDNISSINLKIPLAEEKNNIIKAFQAADLFDQSMKTRIDEHFAATEEVLKRIAKSTKKKPFEFKDIFIIPLIGRTKTMAEFARQLEEERQGIFAPLNKFIEIISSFLKDKSIKMDENGNLIIKSDIRINPAISPVLLSSGEKQIIILLSHALLRGNRSIIYVADEPELSLHVQWQEKLLPSLLEFGKHIQIIVATHSPDIVGKFIENVIDLGEHTK